MAQVLELSDMDFKAAILTVIRGNFISLRACIRKQENYKLMI